MGSFQNERRTTKTRRKDRDLLLEQHLKCFAGRAHEFRAEATARFGLRGWLRDVVVFLQLLHEVAVSLGDHCLDIFAVAFDERCRDKKVDAEGLVPHAFLNPANRRAKLVGLEAYAAEDSDAAGIRNGGNDVLRVGKCNDRYFAAIFFAKPRMERVA